MRSDLHVQFSRGGLIHYLRQQAITIIARWQGDMHDITTARRRFHGFAFVAFNILQLNSVVTLRRQHLQPVAHGEAVFHLHLGHAPRIVESGDFTDELLLVAAGIIIQIVLIVLIRVALVKSFRITSIGQSFQLFV